MFLLLFGIVETPKSVLFIIIILVSLGFSLPKYKKLLTSLVRLMFMF